MSMGGFDDHRGLFSTTFFYSHHNIKIICPMPATSPTGQLNLLSPVRTMRRSANNANSWYNKGIILFKMCRYQDALNSFAQAADIDPEFTEAWFNKGMVLMCSGKYLEAIRAFNKLLKIHPHDVRAREQLDLAQRKIMESGCHTVQSSGKQTKLG